MCRRPVASYSIGQVRYKVCEEEYEVVEPPIDGKTREIVGMVTEYIAKKGLTPSRRNIEMVIDKLGVNVDDKYMDIIQYYVVKAVSPWDFLYPLILDRRLEEISVTNNTLKVIHRYIASQEYIPVVGVKIPSEEALREYAQRLAAAYGSSINTAFPITEFDAEGRRVTIVLGTIASSTTISIRMHPEKPLTLEELVRNNTLSSEIAEYLVNVLRSRGVIFVVGHQGSGKTTLVNALLDEAPKDWKIVVIEDVPEIRLVKHDHWVSLRTRRLKNLAESGKVEITFKDLIRVSLRLGGQVTTLTEARGEEVKDLLEIAALGEAVVATFHARDWNELLQRLKLLGVAKHYLSLIWSVVVMGKVRLRDGTMARRVIAVYEVLPDTSYKLLYYYDRERDRHVKVDDSSRLRFSQHSVGIWEACCVKECRTEARGNGWRASAC